MARSEPPYVSPITHQDWSAAPSRETVAAAGRDLEAGAVLHLPGLAFAPESSEVRVFSPTLAAAKNISFDPASGRLGGARATAAEETELLALLRRFSESAARLVDNFFPAYRGEVLRGRASFRPAEIEGRATSWRKDDTRLHVDSFPATPVHGRRILRVFTNVNPHGRPRSWRIGEEFEAVARRFAGALRMPVPGLLPLLRALRVTKTERTAYDHLMLQLHDRMKADAAYQADARQTSVHFHAGSTWMAFTDQVSHAAMSGQYQLEQTFLRPVEAMAAPERAPLRVLERLTGRRLV
jgi:hypothetical protein